MLVAIVVSLLLGLVATGLGIAALRKTPTSAGGPEPVMSLVVPSGGTTVAGISALDAKAIGPNVVAVDFVATGGRLHSTRIGTGTASLVGWVSRWDTRSEANGTYNLVSIGYNAQGLSSPSSSIVITIKN
jgi:hypothetical protein